MPELRQEQTKKSFSKKNGNTSMNDFTLKNKKHRKNRHFFRNIRYMYTLKKMVFSS